MEYCVGYLDRLVVMTDIHVCIDMRKFHSCYISKKNVSKSFVLCLRSCEAHAIELLRWNLMW